MKSYARKRYKKLLNRYKSAKKEMTRLHTLYNELEQKLNETNNMIEIEKNINYEFGSMNLNLIEINKTLYYENTKLTNKIKELEKDIKNKFCCIM